ncbi:hypothetical protein GCM10022254_26310 [Actinomadura meridiana]|uniref:Uncharacterized protein n=2 Tax=Actinomadura meridiana TaxID=559626 RepID=A0ABP8BYZ0_9ACTN
MGRPGPRRSAPGRSGAPRSRTPARRPPRQERPAPPPPAPVGDGSSEYGADYDDAHETVPPPRAGKKRSGKKRRGGKQHGPKLYFGAAAVLGVLVLVGLGVLVLRDGGDAAHGGVTAHAKIGKPAGTGPSPDSYSSSPTTEAYAGIASRSTDSAPLTIAEAFPSSATELAVPDSDVKVKLRAKRLDGDCAAAVWGGTVGDVLGEGGCTQAVRGIYADDDHALAVAVFNLAQSADADRFVETLEKTRGAGFVRPLEAPAPLDGFGRGFGMARGLAMGHFAVVTWAERVDGKGDEKDETLLSLLIAGGQAPAVLGRAARASN